MFKGAVPAPVISKVICMFTGIIEAIGTIRALSPKGGDVRVYVETGKLDLGDVKLGDSIAVNGVCLTAVELPGNGFWADVSRETLDCTAMNDLKAGSPVNLEKALRLNRQQPRALLEMAELSYEDRHYVPARDYYERFSLLSGQNARSLLLGVRLATVHEERDTAARFGQQLERLYPGTPEYQQYLSEQ